MSTVFSAKDNAPINLRTMKGISFVFTMPAAFSGTCTGQCMPGVIGRASAIRAAGAERIIAVTADQPHALNAWIRENGWENSGIEFASDFGSFQIREIVGRLSEQDGSADLPQVIGNLLRRAYLVFVDGEIAWKFIEPDAKKFTLDFDVLESVIAKRAAGRSA